MLFLSEMERAASRGTPQIGKMVATASCKYKVVAKLFDIHIYVTKTKLSLLCIYQCCIICSGYPLEFQNW